jgi:hypothetical protein
MRVMFAEGDFEVVIHRHDLPVRNEVLPCWTFVTEGLRRNGQIELRMTVLRGDDEYPPEDPLKLAVSRDAAARAGHLAHAGDLIRFAGDEGPFGRHVAFIHPPSLTGLDLPQDMLAVISVTVEELDAIQQFGMLRVMARLGRQATYFPCPPWIDRSRPGLSFERAARESMLSRVQRLYCPGLRILAIGDRLELRASENVRTFLRTHLARIPEEVPVALLGDLDRTADGLFVWDAGQRSAEAIAPAGSRGERVCGCFMLFATGDVAGGTREDGMFFVLRMEEWRAMRRALCDGGALEAPADGGRPALSLRWDDGWYVFTPRGARAPRAPGQRATIREVRLLSTQEVVAANTTVTELADFCREVERAMEASLSRSRLATHLIARFRIGPKSFHVDYAARADLEPELREEMHRAVSAVAPLRANHDEFAFELHMMVDA